MTTLKGLGVDYVFELSVVERFVGYHLLLAKYDVVDAYIENFLHQVSFLVDLYVGMKNVD